jgi:hypothetical protein
LAPALANGNLCICQLFAAVLTREIPNYLLGSMGNNEPLRKGEGRLAWAVTINLDREHKDMYDRLTGELRVRAAEHLRRVIYPELERLVSAAENEPPAA